MRESTDTDLEYLRQWIGRTETCDDVVTAVPVSALAATLDLDAPPPRPGDPLPLLWHWLFCLSLHRRADLADDGHARLGAFLPPIGLPRRMYAGGSLDVRLPIRIGDPVSRVSRVVDVSSKRGRSGALVFVKVRHDFSTRDGLALTESQDLVYREVPRPDEAAAAARPAPDQAAWTREIQPDDVLLFRYSALTFNAYRIHYDRRFATEVQGYPGLVVHGPLIATLLADLLRRHLPDAKVSQFSFRAVRALFDGAPFSVCGSPAPDGRTVQLWAKEESGALAMDATATLGR